MNRYDVVIIGAGIVGLAAAHKLRESQSQLRVAVVEKEPEVACHQTGHNSGVIHSGIYYKPGSLKALNCLRGYQQLLDYLKINNIKHEICGKLIVATQRESVARLQLLKDQGEANQLMGLKMLSAKESQELEPHIQCHQSLWIPQAGIVDYKAVARHLYQSLKNQGVDFFFNHPVTDLKESKSRCSIITPGNSFECDHIINCAGLYSDQVAEKVNTFLDVRILPFRGEYYELHPRARHLVKNLIYPVPDSRFPFLGVHLTRTMNGGVECGPNAVLALAKEGYSWEHIHLGELLSTLGWPGFYKMAIRYWDVGVMEVARSLFKSKFTKSLQELIPEVSEEDLIPGGSGVRAQACRRDGQLLDDFYIIQGMNSIHVLNAPSPAATSCFAIGEALRDLYFNKVN